MRVGHCVPCIADIFVPAAVSGQAGWNQDEVCLLVHLGGGGGIGRPGPLSSSASLAAPFAGLHAGGGHIPTSLLHNINAD